MFGRKKPTEDDNLIVLGGYSEALVEANRRANERYEARTAELQARLDAIEEPPDRFRIEKKFQNGTYTVSGWTKGIRHWADGSGFDDRYVHADWEPLTDGLPTIKAAESWLKAYLDPTTNQIGYDAEGKRIEVRP